jgi:hypothetical protein
MLSNAFTGVGETKLLVITGIFTKGKKAGRTKIRIRRILFRR